MRDVLNGQITRRDKSLTGFSICCQRNSICLRLDMFAPQTRDLSHIELARSDNISTLNEVKAYRVNEVDISTERKNRARIEGFISFYPCSFLPALLSGIGVVSVGFSAGSIGKPSEHVFCFKRFVIYPFIFFNLFA